MKELSKELLCVVDEAVPTLRAISDPESIEPILPGGWSRKQVIGHLIDSTSNNHQRIVRALVQASLEFPGYDQDANVRAQAIQEVDWSLLVTLWAAYSRYLAHVIAQVPASKLATSCRIDSGEAVTLDYLAKDYISHTVHHLSQISLTTSN
jgi:hypothetical protein